MRPSGHNSPEQASQPLVVHTPVQLDSEHVSQAPPSAQTSGSHSWSLAQARQATPSQMGVSPSQGASSTHTPARQLCGLLESAQRVSPSLQTHCPLPVQIGVGEAQSCRLQLPSSSQTRRAEVLSSLRHWGDWLSGSHCRHSPPTHASPSAQASLTQVPSSQISRPAPALIEQRGSAVSGLHATHCPSRQTLACCDIQFWTCQLPFSEQRSRPPSVPPAQRVDPGLHAAQLPIRQTGVEPLQSALSQKPSSPHLRRPD